jgi:EAL domain-containing protein (putative c-di-GMP-specific phosphodiesterase class I)
VPNVANRHALTEKVAHLQQQLAQPIIVNGQTFKTSACYGLDVCNHLDVLAGGWEDSSETFIKRANVAMHDAKLYKRGSWSFYEDTLLKSTTEKFIIGQGLFSALELGQLEVYYQPQFFIDAGCKKISGIEALLRWQHPQQGFVNPELIIKVAESTGQILEVDKYVLRRALKDFASLEALGIAPKSISVNLSIMSLEQIDFSEFFKDLHDVSFLTLEIIESKLIKNLAAVKDRIKCLREKGIKISLDDFGTGYSSLQYLKTLTIDEIKIDQSFISNWTNSHADMAILSTITQMAKSLGLPTVAEGIESQEQLDILASLGCNYGQGYLCNKAMPVNHLIAFLESCHTA